MAHKHSCWSCSHFPNLHSHPSSVIYTPYPLCETPAISYNPELLLQPDTSTSSVSLSCSTLSFRPVIPLALPPLHIELVLSCLSLAPPPCFPTCFCMKWRSCFCQNLGVLSDTSITSHPPYYLVLRHLLPNIFPVELVMLWPLLPPQFWSLLPLAQVIAIVPLNLESHQVHSSHSSWNNFLKMEITSWCTPCLKLWGHLGQNEKKKSLTGATQLKWSNYLSTLTSSQAAFLSIYHV